MDQYFSRIKYFKDLKELPSRIRFMLQDVIELRESKVSFSWEILWIFLELGIGQFSDTSFSRINEKVSRN